MNTNTKHWASITAGILSLAGYASAASLGSEKYTYDSSGNIIEKSIDGQVTKMTYDPSNRLTERQAAGQNKEITEYDTAGRPVAKKDGEGKQTRSISYGYGDKVVNAKNHGSDTSFFYNAEGQIVGTNSEEGFEAFAWDGLAIVSRGKKTYVNQSHSVGEVPALIGNDVAVSDMIGSTLRVGNKSIESSAYGEGVEEGFFTGKPYVAALDSYVFKYRNYSAGDARWTSADPAGFPDGINNGAYVLGNPVSNIDPLGLWTSEGQPPTGQTNGTLTTQAPTHTPIVIFTNTVWARKFTNNKWDDASNNDDSGAKGDALNGSFTATTTTTITLSLGVSQAPISVGASASSASAVGVTQSYNKPATPGTAWRCKGLVGKGDVGQVEADYQYNKATGVWVLGTQTASTPYVNHVVPGISGKEYLYEN